jgi:hypothetical protein
LRRFQRKERGRVSRTDKTPSNSYYLISLLADLRREESLRTPVTADPSYPTGDKNLPSSERYVQPPGRGSQRERFCGHSRPS